MNTVLNLWVVKNLPLISLKTEKIFTTIHEVAPNCESIGFESSNSIHSIPVILSITQYAFQGTYYLVHVLLRDVKRIEIPVYRTLRK